MDSLITAAARALAQGDPLGALKRVALRDDAPALALRGIAMAQLGDFGRAKELLKKAERRFGTKEGVARARCVVAEAEIALASRDLSWPTKALDGARKTLESHGDWTNAAHARQLEIRRLVLIGRLDDAEDLLEAVATTHLSPSLLAIHELLKFGVAIRRLRPTEARGSLQQARRAARSAGIPALVAETDNAARALHEPSAQLVTRGGKRLLLLDEVESILASKALVIDACRFIVRDEHSTISLARRPLLLSLLRALAEAWPQDASRSEVIARVFRIKRADESHRVRLRVEIGRLRTAIKTLATITATKDGFILVPRVAKEIVVLAPPVEDANASVLALLADGQSWSSSAIALALNASQRSVQRAVDTLASEGKIQSIGLGRARRWVAAPLPGFATTLLLPALVPTL